MGDSSASLRDGFHRRINYLRMSITDRCNLRCRYCMPEEGVPPLSHAEILTYEELLRLARVAAGLGIHKVRVTGGEPLVRRGAVEFVRLLAALPGVKDLSLTTNGILLDEYASPLRQAGLQRVNVSLDTLRPDRYRAITRCGELDRVLKGLEAARREELSPVKVNVVTLRDFNLDEVEDFARLTLESSLEVRFIECMPLGGFQEWNRSRVVPGAEIREQLEKSFSLVSTPESSEADGPSRMVRIEGAQGRIGFINPLTEHFCGTCNRLRLLPDGTLRTCLFSTEGTDLRTPLRAGISDERLAEIVREAAGRKPKGHGLGEEGPFWCSGGLMSRIGG